MTAPSPLESGLRSRRTAFVITALMLAASAGALVARPAERLADADQAISLERMIPRQFGDWREAQPGRIQVVNPQTQELLDRIYGQIVARTYVNSDGYLIMLSIGYGNNLRDRGSLQAHRPEVCYPAQGFVVEKNEISLISTRSGDIPVRRLVTTLGERHEPLIYWFTVGDTVVRGKLHKRLVDLRYGLTGLIPDGILFRVSSIDRDEATAYRMQEQFINQLLQAVPAQDRVRLSGLSAT